MSQPLCILIHGFTGSPWEVTPLAEELSRSGYEVITPLLPGHHDTKRRMKKVQASDWIDTIEELTERAMNDKRTIHLIGFSMGAMIAAIIGYRRSIRSLVLLSPAVYVITPNVFVVRSKHTFKLMRENRTLFRKMIRTNFVSLRSAPLYNVLQFQKVVSEAKRVIPYITTPVCIIHGSEDEIADPKGSVWIYEAVKSQDKELHILSDSRHLVCHGVDANFLAQTVAHFLKRHGYREE